VANIARKSWGIVLFTALAAAAGIAFNQTTISAPLVSLPDTPLYVNGSKAKANLTLALSVETPTLGTAYPSTAEGDPNAFDPTKRYVGYHDHMVCYVNVTASDVPGGEYFAFSSAKATIDAPCPTGRSFDGNFLNWATTSAIDIMRYGLTGGHRVFDEGTGTGRTVLERAYLPGEMYRSPFFLMKRLRMDQIALRTPFSISDFTDGLYIRNCHNRVYFSKSNDTTGSCAMPFFDATAQSAELVKTGASTAGRYYLTRVMVCDTNTAGNRLMLQNPQTRQWSGLCLPYQNARGGSFYKPVGQFQVNADNVRVSVFSYLNDDNYARYGGVMRAPLKYLGPRQFDANFDLIPQTNPHREWDSLTGVFIRNPQLGHADYGDQGYGQSGVISYINGFGALNTDELGASKDYDPVGELYYEAFRYLQGQQPTPLAITGLTGVQATDRALTENFPAYRVWKDPFNGFTDNTGKGRSCLRNSLLTVADVFTHSDRYLPGNTLERYNDGVRNAEQTPVSLDVQHWTGIVGSFEANVGAPYTDSTGAARKAFNISPNSPYRPDLPNIATDPFVETGATGSFMMAGLAHFANTQTFRADLPKARISTFSIDVNSYNLTGASASLRRGTQLHLAAKYGGFDDALTGNTGSPFAAGNNFAWQGANGDAKNVSVQSTHLDRPQAAHLDCSCAPM
jgi:type IV pilus assembly protein PilY1